MKETKTAYILATIRTKGFIEAKNINQLALKLDIKPENLRHIIDAIEVANAVNEETKKVHNCELTLSGLSTTSPIYQGFFSPG